MSVAIIWFSIFVMPLIFYLYVTRNSNYWSKRGVKDVKQTFFFGNIGPCLLAKRTPGDLIDEIYKKGDGEELVGFYIFDKPYIIIRDPRLVKDVLIKDFWNFSNKIRSGNYSDVMTRVNLTFVGNPQWRNVKQKLSPVFTTRKLKNMFAAVMEVCNDFQDHLDKLEIDDTSGKRVEIINICHVLTTDLIGATTFGVSIKALKDPNTECRRNVRDIFHSNFKRYLELLAMFFVPQLRFFVKPRFGEKSTAFFRDTFWTIINHRMESGNKRGDFVDLLIDIKQNQEKDHQDKFKLEGDALIAQAVIFFTGGIKTCSTMMSFCLYLLAKNPEAQSRLRTEILEALAANDGKATYEIIATLPYLNMVLCETMRIYPIIPWLDRVPDKDYTFAGTDVTVQKGVPVILPLKTLQNDPKYFPNPEQFIPERFSEENKQNITPYSYFPFGDGPRQCIGIRLGQILTKLAVANFISKYELTYREETDVKMDNFSVFTQAKGGIHLHLKKLST